MPTPLGVQYRPDASTFSVFAEADSIRLRLRLVHPGTREVHEQSLERLPDELGVWTATVKGDWRGWAYSYEVERDGRTLTGIFDPWAKLIRDGRAFIVHDETPVVPRPPLDPADAVVYELHVRDFTHDPSSGVNPDWRGKFLGLTQRGTRVEGMNLATGLDHILELGVNTVQLMPVNSFAYLHHPEYEWGYMPLDYNAPHPGYASSLDLEAPIREFKRLVSTLHQAGLRVVIDVVYNHTAERWPDRLHSFMALAPRHYFRFTEDGTPWNGSKCGNEFRSESPQGRRFIVESCRYWVTEFGVDGFRFDLMALIDRETMEAVARELHAIDPTILLYGEPWAAGPTPIEVTGKGVQRGRGWGCFNDDFRDGFRGDVFNPDDRGFLAGGNHVSRCKGAVLAGVKLWADSPLECINFLECHDNRTLADRLALAVAQAWKGPSRALRDMKHLGALALLTSPGIPFIHSGQEFARSKGGEENSYNLGDHINNIRWHNKADEHELFEFYRALIRLRREHPMFRLSTGEQVRQSVRFFDDHLRLFMPEGTLAWMVSDPTGRDGWSAAAVVLNGSSEEKVVPLPEGQWFCLVMDGRVDWNRTPRMEGSITLPGHWGALLFRPR